MDSSAARKPPSFPMPPKSALFDRLEAFLPKMASENEKLEAAIASGEGDRHNIEIPEPDADDSEANKNDSDDEDASDVDMDDSRDTPTQAPVIEMNFALGMMEEGGSDSDSSEEEEPADVDLATILAARGQQETDGKALQLPRDTPAAQQAKRPLIQELN